jgi:hypothetical protein
MRHDKPHTAAKVSVALEHLGEVVVGKVTWVLQCYVRPQTLMNRKSRLLMRTNLFGYPKGALLQRLSGAHALVVEDLPR